MTTPSATALSQLQGIYAKAGFSVQPGVKGQAAAQGFKLRDAVLANFVGFSTPLEGKLTYMYTDVKGLVTTGMGNLIDPMNTALALPWQSADGSAATQSQIQDAWNAVKQAYPKIQSSGPATMGLTSIRLTDAGVAQLVNSKLKQNDEYLSSRIPGYALFPADAQLAIHSMAWAMGPGFISTFKTFLASLSKNPPDFASAAGECGMQTAGNPGVVPRNTADVVLLNNAAAVAGGGGDPETGALLLEPPCRAEAAGSPQPRGLWLPLGQRPGGAAHARPRPRRRLRRLDDRRAPREALSRWPPKPPSPKAPPPARAPRARPARRPRRRRTPPATTPSTYALGGWLSPVLGAIAAAFALGFACKDPPMNSDPTSLGLLSDPAAGGGSDAGAGGASNGSGITLPSLPNPASGAGGTVFYLLVGVGVGLILRNLFLKDD